ncbi:Hypothetical_protein [Hexamita inflata]|uniref:Hypothetical_protein n=1 Tax=Hexamita inflata TaxID=28002 RepID=A0ABP1GDY0_9EUKA
MRTFAHKTSPRLYGKILSHYTQIQIIKQNHHYFVNEILGETNIILLILTNNNLALEPIYIYNQGSLFSSKSNYFCSFCSKLTCFCSRIFYCSCSSLQLVCRRIGSCKTILYYLFINHVDQYVYYEYQRLEQLQMLVKMKALLKNIIELNIMNVGVKQQENLEIQDTFIYHRILIETIQYSNIIHSFSIL